MSSQVKREKMSHDFGYDGDNGNTPGDWGGDELQHADGWITTWAGDSLREVSTAAEADTEEIMNNKEKQDEKEKQARRCSIMTECM